MVDNKEFRQKAEDLMATLEIWDGLIPGSGKVHLIACGGTALTLLGYKPSTKDVDFLVPNEKEYKSLVNFLKKAGYRPSTGHGWKREGELVVYDLFEGKTVFNTELLHSPLLPGRNTKVREFKKIYLGILNSIDLIITKLARGSSVDYDDCLALLQNESIDLTELKKEYKEAARHSISFGTQEEKAMRNLDQLLDLYQKNK